MPSSIPIDASAEGSRAPLGLWMQAERIVRISRVVSALDRAETFYGSVLGFSRCSRGPVEKAMLSALGTPETRATESVMRLGREEIALIEFETAGRVIPADSRSNDLWFQHLAIVVNDMQAAYGHLRANPGWQPISSDGPEILRASNGLSAFKFRDPDGHPLELLWFPPGAGRSIWHERRDSDERAMPFLGIDHSALAISSTRGSLAFYRSLGLLPQERSLNRGPAQSRLDDLRAARVKVTSLRPASSAGPGLELLAYQPPGRRAAGPSITDLSCDWTTLAAVTASVDPAPSVVPRLITDPDGHRLLITEAARA